jgi:hypothetical protein
LDDIAGYWEEVVDKDMDVDSDEELKVYLKHKYGKNSVDEEGEQADEAVEI